MLLAHPGDLVEHLLAGAETVADALGQHVAEAPLAGADPAVDESALGHPALHDQRGEAGTTREEAEDAVPHLQELVHAVHGLADRDDTCVADDVEQRLEVVVVLLIGVERAQAMR